MNSGTKRVKATGHVTLFCAGDAASEARRRVREAKTRVLYASYTAPDEGMSEVLCSLQKSGTSVRVVTSATTPAWSSDADQCVAHRRVVSLTGTMHAKFIVIDDAVLVGSSNWNDSGSYNVIVELTGPVVRQFVTQFKKLWSSAEADLTAEPSKDLLEKVVAYKGWSRFTVTLSRRLNDRGFLTPRETEALRRTLNQRT